MNISSMEVDEHFIIANYPNSNINVIFIVENFLRIKKFGLSLTPVTLCKGLSCSFILAKAAEVHGHYTLIKFERNACISEQ